MVLQQTITWRQGIIPAGSYENKRSTSRPIATPASAAATPIETVSSTVRVVLRFAIRARPIPSPMSKATVTAPETIRA